MAATLVLFGIPLPATAGLRISGVFGDHIVLQRHQPVMVWGWADKGQQVNVAFAGQSVSTTVDDTGAWRVSMAPLQASAEGHDLQVRCGGQILTIHDVLVGDVWHASGQSNMAMTVAAVTRKIPWAAEQVREANLPGIRFCRINENESVRPLKDLSRSADWTLCSPKTVHGFSAAAFYFARKVHAETAVPIGIIDTSRGGTPIEPFIPREAFHSHPTLKRELELGDQGDLVGLQKLVGGVRARNANWLPGRLFHSRIAPITRLPVRGVIWYQGESNCGDGEDPRHYEQKMRALITGWRESLGNNELPFYFVQLPGSGARAGWPYLREQQRLSCDIPHTGMAVTIDLLDGDIHPPNKVDVGERLAAWALARQYGKEVVPSGPLFERAEFVAGKAIVQFSYAESGLMVAIKEGLAAASESPQTKLSHFELADEAGQWCAAEAVIKDRSVIVRSAKVGNPIAVRYAYDVDPQHCHLYNRDGLPASPFCSDPTMLVYQPEPIGD